MSRSLSDLVCGSISGRGDLAEILRHVSDALDHKLEELEAFKGRSDLDVAHSCPFLARTIMELSLTAVLGRLDPFRLLIVRKLQKDPNYNLSTRWKLAVQWAGDIIYGASQKYMPITETVSVDKISRCLLGGYYRDVFWETAIFRFSGSLPATASSSWLSELRLIDPDEFLDRIRGELNTLYSALSKGVHYEFVVPVYTLYDRPTVTTYVNDALKLVSHVGLVSHSIETIMYPHDLTTALDLYDRVQKEETF